MFDILGLRWIDLDFD